MFSLVTTSVATSNSTVTSTTLSSPRVSTLATSAEGTNNFFNRIVEFANLKIQLFISFVIATRGPNDITPIGDDFDMRAQMEKFKNFKFPKSGDGKDQRSFQLQWFTRYDWLEYSVSLDAAFCYNCRQFGEMSKDSTFTFNGYRAWRSALTDKRGFSKHSTSIGHMNASVSYAEKKKHAQSGTSVSGLLNDTVLAKRRYYCKTIVEVILFLA